MFDFTNEYYKQICASALKEYTYLTYDEFLTYYNEESRYFHTIMHLEYILNYIEEHQSWYMNDIIILTTMFHDIVYYSHMNNNEKQSANLFKKVYKYSADLNVYNEVITCILDTKDRNNPTDYCKIFNEADMAILYDTNKMRLLQYEKNIMAEYDFLSYNEYKKQRIKFLNEVKDDLNKYNIELLISIINDKDLFNNNKNLKDKPITDITDI
jgi:predicted metal-dependent HD superfamily phosphohydrolase